MTQDLVILIIALTVFNGLLMTILRLMGTEKHMLRFDGKPYGPWVRRYGRLVSSDVNLGQRREIYRAYIGRQRFIRVLHVRNHSLEPDGSRKEYWLGVPERCRTPAEAVAWSFGISPWVYREDIAS
jgi:hypothetical protein